MEPVVVITGGSGSLGSALVEAFSQAGWRVLAPTRQEMDVTEASAVQQWFSTKGNAVDLLINAAGIVADGLFATMPEAAWDAVCRTNLKGTFLCSQAAAQCLQARKSPGHIINIGSAASFLGTPGQTNYAAAKAGVIALTQSLAAEWGPYSIRVNCVLPGWLEPSRMTDAAAAAARQATLDRHVLGEFNTAATTAQFILALNALEATSGQVFQLDSRLRRV